MTDSIDRYTIVFNGEIYNYRELGRRLTEQGVRFSSASDTEVLLHAYARWGIGCLPRLRGMFAFVVWDAKERRLFAARDRFGMKPLFARVLGAQLWLGSQVRALAKTAPGLTRSASAHAGFLTWGHVPDPLTPFEEISAVPAGHCVTWSPGDSLPFSTTSWFDLPDEVGRLLRDDAVPSVSKREAQTLVAQSLTESVKAHLVADVPVGVFLSSGMDSSTLASLQVQIAPVREVVHSVTLGFREYAGTRADETPGAEALATYLGTRHKTVWVSQRDFLDEIPHLFRAMDQPTIDGVNTYFASLVARQTGLKVALSGLGGDELFGGYPSFRQIPRLARLPENIGALGRYLRRLGYRLVSAGSRPKVAGILEYSGSFEAAYLLRRALFMPWELPSLMPPDQVLPALVQLDTQAKLAETHRPVPSSKAKVSLLEACWYMRNQLLRDSDWASMAHGLELRLPLVDWPLWQTVLPLAATSHGIDKRTMAAAPNKPLPETVLARGKTGFQVPIVKWLAEIDTPERGAPPSHGLRGWALQVWERWFETVGL